MSVEDAKLLLAIQSFSETLSSSKSVDSRNFIVGGNVTGVTSSGTYNVKTTYGTGSYSAVSSPSKAAASGSGVLLGNPDGDGQDMVVIGMSGYYYP